VPKYGSGGGIGGQIGTLGGGYPSIPKYSGISGGIGQLNGGNNNEDSNIGGRK